MSTSPPEKFCCLEGVHRINTNLLVNSGLVLDKISVRSPYKIRIFFILKTFLDQKRSKNLENIVFNFENGSTAGRPRLMGSDFVFKIK